VAAEPAIAVYPAHPGDADARSDRQVRGCAFHHFADDLMTGNDAFADGRKITFDDMEISAADAASNDLEQYLAGPRLRLGEIFDGYPVSGGI
jgi:hypothetical protein